ncbi:MAG: hypothetical protein ACRBBW_14645 [Cellvibrionaceae bacterium]
MPQLSASITTVYEAAEASAKRFGDLNAIRFLQSVSPEIVDQTITFEALFHQINQSIGAITAKADERKTWRSLDSGPQHSSKSRPTVGRREYRYSQSTESTA